MASWMICLPQDPPPVTGLVDPQIDYDKLVRIGWIALNANGNAANRKCNLGMVLHKDYQGKGYGTEAVKHAIRYAFVSANQRRIELDAFLWNEPAIKAYTKCGFTIEGVKKESVWFQGRFYDEGIMSATSSVSSPHRLTRKGIGPSCVETGLRQRVWRSVPCSSISQPSTAICPEICLLPFRVQGRVEDPPVGLLASVHSQRHIDTND